jgi:hypothetical protein
MNIPEIERLITEAICNRPKVTTAPLNLYLYGSKLVCGARIVMPKDAQFVAYVHDNCLEKGFSDKEWKLIVQKIDRLTNNHTMQQNRPEQTPPTDPHKRTILNERRSEQRLYYRRPMWYFHDLNHARHKGRTADVSSNGVGFTCSMNEKNRLRADQQINTRIDVPLFNRDGNYDMIRFDRTGRVRRVDKLNSSTHRVALEFTKPLPFKPAEQGLPGAVIEKKLAVANLSI